MKIASKMRGLGTETAFEVMERAQALRARGRSIVNLGIGQPDFPTPPHIVEAGRKALADGHHGYTPPNGIQELREAIAADLWRRRQVEVDPDQVVVVPGGKVTIAFAALMFGEFGAEILFPDPGYPIYASMARFSGAVAVPYPLREADGFSLRADDVLSRITGRTRLIIINSPANPTGGLISKTELDRLVEGLERHPGVAILSDEIYSQMIYGGERHLSLLDYESIRGRLILLDGFSKTYAMTGWRLGWGIWPGDLAERASRLAINFVACPNASAQWAGLAALTGPQDSIGHMMQAFSERRATMVDGLNRLPGVRCTEPGGAFFSFANIRGTGFSAEQLQDQWLEEAGVAAIAGTSFGALGEGYVRFSFASSTFSIQEGLARIERWLRMNRLARAPLRSPVQVSV